MSTMPMAPACEGLDPATAAFYVHVLETLNASGVPYLVGGAYAFNCYTGIQRHTKDLDLFIRRDDYPRIAAALAPAGYKSELAYPHWLAKVHAGPAFVDLVFGSGNGIANVDDVWFVHARDAEVLGVPVRITPVEETLWSKAFIMERERYDGADVAHLIRHCADGMDWPRLLERFDGHWRVLLSHLILFGFIYPAERALVPAGVMNHLLDRLRAEMHAPPTHGRLCKGTLLSREQYLNDVEAQAYEDGRMIPFGTMTPDEIAIWTEAIPDRAAPHDPSH